MSRFDRIVEDPDYEEPAVAEGWDDLLDGFVSVVIKPHMTNTDDPIDFPKG